MGLGLDPLRGLRVSPAFARLETQTAEPRGQPFGVRRRTVADRRLANIERPRRIAVETGTTQGKRSPRDAAEVSAEVVERWETFMA